MAAEDAIYVGDVTHKRVGPVSHGLRYRVFSLLLDCDRLGERSGKPRLFSHNRFNLISIFDRDYGDGRGLPAYLRAIADKSGHGGQVRRFVMLCYPRVLGYVFNPLTVYYGLDHEDRVRLSIYEVTNTFGERKSYVIPARPNAAGLVWQRCPKQFFVSPFNKVSGSYSFHLSPIGETLTLGVALKDNDKPVLRAHFHGRRKAFSDSALLKALAGSGLMTVKVIAGIHYEALKLWLKGLRLETKPAPPAHAISYFADPLSGKPLIQHSDGNVEHSRKADPGSVGQEQQGGDPVDRPCGANERDDRNEKNRNYRNGKPELVKREEYRRPEPVHH